jgi:long-chain acyl-CoA synthetase
MEKIWLKNWPAGVPREIEYLLGEKPLFEYLRSHAKTHPDKPAINFYGKEISYAAFDRLTDLFASYLSRDGLEKGDRVALYLPNCPQYSICQIGAHKAGAIVVPCGPMFKAWELEEELVQTGAKTIVCLDELYPIVKEAHGKCKFDRIVVTGFADFLPETPSIPIHETMRNPRADFPDAVELMETLEDTGQTFSSPKVGMKDICLLQFTSGTTGLPKAAMLTHAGQLFKSASATLVYGIDASDVMLTAMPMYHIAGMLFGLTTPIYAGGAATIMTRFETETMAAAIQTCKCSKMYGTVSMNAAILHLPNLASYDLTSMRTTLATSFGIALNQQIADAWQTVTKGGLMVEAAYGLSETHTFDTFSPLDKPRIGSVGIPNIGTEIAIVDFDDPGIELAPGQVGEITVRSPAVFKGYWGREDATIESLRDGILYTGDMGQFDEDGYLYFIGRKKEMIKASGFAIAPEEVENFLTRHSAVREAACIPIPDAARGESVKAFVVLEPDHVGMISEEELIEWAKGKMAAYKYPRVIEFRSDIPKTLTGKILRRVLKEEETSKQ